MSTFPSKRTLASVLFEAILGRSEVENLGKIDPQVTQPHMLRDPTRE